MIQNKILTDGDLSKIYSFTVWTGVLLAVLFFRRIVADCRVL